MRRSVLTSAGRVLGVAIALTLGPLFAGAASAGEPQILGIVASAEPVPLTCDEYGCTAQLSAFCLQRHRAVPFAGTPYVPAPGSEGAFTLVATDATGARVRHSVDEAVTFHSARGNRAVTLHLDAAVLAASDLSRPALAVGARASLVPQTVAARLDDPQVAAEVALVAGPLRVVAEREVDRGGSAIDAARALNRQINRRAAAGIDEVGAGGPPTWYAGADEPAAAEGDGPGVAMARDAFARCAASPGGGFVTFRQCLSAQHDMFIDPLNRAYWQAVSAGS